MLIALMALMTTMVSAGTITFGTESCDDGPGGFNYANNIYVNFTYPETVSLTGGSIYFGHSSSDGSMDVALKNPGDANQIVNGTPLVTTASSIPVGSGDVGTYVDFTFSSPYEIIAGDEYWIEFSTPDGANMGLAMDCNSGPGIVWYSDEWGLQSIWWGEIYPAYDSSDPVYNESQSQLLMTLTYAEPVPEEPVVRTGGNGGAIAVAQNIAKASSAKASAPTNPITQFILNLRAAILKALGIEG